jgi:hypothetical protein
MTRFYNYNFVDLLLNLWLWLGLSRSIFSLSFCLFIYPYISITIRPSTMLFSRAALAAILLFTVTAPTFTFVNADTGAAFSYDPEAANGPANWGKLEIDGNQCGEKSNSPIAVYTRACDRWGNYEFQVRPSFGNHKIHKSPCVSMISCCE